MRSYLQSACYSVQHAVVSGQRTWDRGHDLANLQSICAHGRGPQYAGDEHAKRLDARSRTTWGEGGGGAYIG